MSATFASNRLNASNTRRACVVKRYPSSPFQSVVPADFTFGNSGRGILRGDHQWNVDFSLFKRFSVGGGSSIEFRAEAFNLLNSVYFGLPNSAVDTATGGRVTSTSNDARSMQFGLKYIF